MPASLYSRAVSSWILSWKNISNTSDYRYLRSLSKGIFRFYQTNTITSQLKVNEYLQYINHRSKSLPFLNSNWETTKKGKVVTWSPAYRSWIAFIWGVNDRIAIADSTWVQEFIKQLISHNVEWWDQEQLWLHSSKDSDSKTVTLKKIYKHLWAYAHLFLG